MLQPFEAGDIIERASGAGAEGFVAVDGLGPEHMYELPSIPRLKLVSLRPQHCTSDSRLAVSSVVDYRNAPFCQRICQRIEKATIYGMSQHSVPSTRSAALIT